MSILFSSILRYQFGYIRKISNYKRYKHNNLRDYKSSYCTLDTESFYYEGYPNIKYYAMHYCVDCFKKLTKHTTKYVISDFNNNE